jgi:hypothetical protein
VEGASERASEDEDEGRVLYLQGTTTVPIGLERSLLCARA